MPTPQLFKGDDLELKFLNSAEPISELLEGQKDLFFDGAYECFALGDLLWLNNYAPLTNAISQAIFRSGFVSIFNAFVFVGSFESYLTVFKAIFGDSVVVTFTVPGPGQLNIAITALGINLDAFVSRYIVDNAYFFDNVVTQAGDQIVFQTIKGFQSQYELEQMLFELVPDGIYTQITLTLG
jgi:hypothetical protein